MITVAVVEDSPEEAARLRLFLKRFGEEQKVEWSVKFYACFSEFQESFASQFDLVFLDIELPDGNGMELARWIRQKDSFVSLIFVTHLAQYAIHGYSVEALDYILKPIAYPTFSMKLQRAIIRILNSRQEPFTVTTGANTIRIDANRLKYVEIYKHHILYHLEDRVIEAYGVLSQVETELPKRGFYRCSNSFIVNFRFVDSFDSTYVYIGEAKIPISRAKKKELVSEYHRYYGDMEKR